MIDIDCFTRILDEIVTALPRELFRELNLGVCVAEKEKAKRSGRGGRTLFVLGEYRVHRVLGRGILLYYGSFAKVFPFLDNEAEARAEIGSVLRHELTHHLESLAGSRDLEIADAKRLME